MTASLAPEQDLQSGETAARVAAELIERIRAEPAYRGVLGASSADGIPAGLGLPRAARLPVVAALLEDAGAPVLLVTDRADHALALFDELRFWVADRRLIFPEPNPLFYERVEWGPTTRRQRLQTLLALAGRWDDVLGAAASPPVIVASARSLMTRTLPLDDFVRACSLISPGSSRGPGSLRRDWARLGYRHVNTVLEPGQFSHRGGLLDIWPLTASSPARLDFFGDDIESIREFDPATQRTVRQRDRIVLSPAREFIDSGDDGLERTEFDITLLHPQAASVLDYLPVGAPVVIDDLGMVESMVAEIEEQSLKFRAEGVADGTIDADHPTPYVTWSEMADALQGRHAIELGYSTSRLPDEGDGARDLQALFGHDERFAGRLKPFASYARRLVDQSAEVVIVSRQAGRLAELFAAEAPATTNRTPTLVEASLSEGFVFAPASATSLHLITDSEIFGWERPRPRLKPRQTAEAPEATYADLQQGDFIVHVDHGIGRFSGLVTRDLDGQVKEYLAVEYGGGGSLFVPVHQADRLTRYIGPDGGLPGLDRLGGQGWHETKRRVTDAVREVAQELLDLYARRHVVDGYAYRADSAWQKELEDSFPYVETDDQRRALAEIKRDMEDQRPMDRLLCGDVGYGKTELALRAAFKAVMDGKQVALLVPTTVLAQQHYETFLQRLAAFPVQAEMLSRFRSEAEQSQILFRLGLGEIDVIIGTHRLLSADVQFKDLGLVIIDEEQRFGVGHKEHLKKLRTEVDVLTLTATPIPRTLYMALTGVRDISNLNTPPEERLSIVTHVGPYSDRLVRQAALRELERGGQIFFVHNRVHSIDAMRSHLARLVPEARIGVGHGQMPEHELAAVMHLFTAGDLDILLSTSIIESGLDIPNANTLIVDRADTFGLAQLYQLRGRVGRGAARAYAYFFRHNKISPTQEGQQRLEVIAENTQLGAGYSIAMRDLEIRGAGELLGARQHGHIAAVGFHLYTRLLADGVRRLRHAAASTAAPDFSPALGRWMEALSLPVNVDLPLAVGIPADYIADDSLRLRLYRRIADLRDDTEIDALREEFRDRFGELPQMVQNLLYQMRVKLRAEKAGLAAVSWENGQLVLRYPPPVNGAASVALPDVGPDIRRGKSAYWCSFGRSADWQERLVVTLERLSPGGLPH